MTNNDDVTCDRKYMKTDTEYNSCVYDLEADFDDLPSNIRLPSTEDINSIIKNTLPLSCKGYFKLTTDRTVPYGIINFLTKLQIFTEKVQVKILNNNFVNIYNCNINDNKLTGSLKDNSSCETPLLKVKTFSRINFNGSSNIIVEVYDNNSDLITTIKNPSNDLLNDFDVNSVNTSTAYFKFYFKTGAYLESLYCYVNDKELITRINNHGKELKQYTGLNTDYKILVNGNKVKTHKLSKDIRKKQYVVNTSIRTNFTIIANNEKYNIRNRKK